MHISAVGDRVVVTLNGEVTADVRHSGLTSGAIALQAGGPGGPGAVRFRSVKVRPRP
jgi:hypothetical protein